ncbi:MAG: NAD(P)-dependent oxidoreductase [Sphingobacteriaceae bacterium]|nr:NAD(P)-dependent oxidoreductase [Sphingobacteriaceae bacterium]
MLEDKRILITGATGFVGWHLAKRLAVNNTVYCVVRKSSNLVKLEKISNINFIYYDGNFQHLKSAFTGIYFDVVYHLASLFIAEHQENDIDGLIDSNIKFPTQLLEALFQTQGKINLINTGTVWQNYTESAYDPACLYAATKQSFEDIIKYYHEVRNTNCITLRLYDTYGPDDERKKLFWLLNDLKNTGRTLDMSPGEQKLNIVHIDDVVNAFIIAGRKVLETSKSINEVYGVYSDHEYTLQEVVKIFESVNGCSLNINWGKREYRKREVMRPQYIYLPLSDWKVKIDLLSRLKSEMA